MKTVAIVPAAGAGKRLGLRTKKPFVALGGRPLVSYAIAALDRSPAIDGMIIAAERALVGRFRALVKKYRFRKVIAVVAGGRTRSESVANCLAMVPDGVRTIIIHDGGRPFPDERLISGSAALARRYGACVTAIPETDTVKLVSGKNLFVKGTLDRRKVFRAQTPQAFRASLLRKAYARSSPSATDDSALIESMGRRVKVLEGSCRNIKVTTREDLRMAEALLKLDKS
jgi:2-C-methyl-D-erythritol 4-phosphate cytidylyltransferase